MKLYIDSNDNGFGVTTDKNIEIVRTRMAFIADHLGIEWEITDGQIERSDEHPLSVRIFEHAMECATPTPSDSSELLAAVTAAKGRYPLQAE